MVGNENMVANRKNSQNIAKKLPIFLHFGSKFCIFASI